jgi:drug/metabolite transporter (DMT)-like permease
MPLVILLFAFFGAVCTIAKLNLSYASPLFIVGSRMTLAGLLLLGHHYIRYRHNFQFVPKQLVLLILLGIFHTYLTNVFFFYSLQELYSYKTCFIYNLSPFISALISYLIFSEILSKNQWLGLTIGFLGFTFLVIDDFFLNSSAGFSLGHLMMLFSVLADVYGWSLMRQLVVNNRCSATFANGAGMMIGGLIALFHSYLVEKWDPLPVLDYSGFFQCSLFLIVFSNFIGYNLYAHLLKKYTVTFMSFAGFLTPFFAAFFSWMLLGEIVTWNFFFTLFTVFIGLLVFHKDQLLGSFPAPIKSMR